MNICTHTITLMDKFQQSIHQIKHALVLIQLIMLAPNKSCVNRKVPTTWYVVT
jgi:hypothetical protein